MGMASFDGSLHRRCCSSLQKMGQGKYHVKSNSSFRNKPKPTILICPVWLLYMMLFFHAPKCDLSRHISKTHTCQCVCFTRNIRQFGSFCIYPARTYGTPLTTIPGAKAYGRSARRKWGGGGHGVVSWLTLKGEQNNINI